MGKLLVTFAAIILASTCLPAEAAMWGGNYLTNDEFGDCGDGRLSPDIRIANCLKAAQWNQPLSSELEQLDSLASAYEDKSDYTDAVLILSKAVGFAQDSKISYQLYLRGFAYLNEGKADLAIADFKAAGHEGGNSYSYTGLAEVAAADGRYHDAIDLYNKAVALNLNDGSILRGRANVYARMGDYDKAIADDNVLVENYHNESFPYATRCWDRAISNRDIDGALADCKHALDLLPDEPDSQDSLGFVLFRQQKWDEAIASYTAALSHNPYLASSLYMRGISELRKGDTAKGQADIDRAMAIYPQIGAQYSIYGVAP
ncbi:MAG TPA: tetratricopeptide repeat protein [Rhizomicrobium sp.]|nr:tetratricopeptide repeat protein [Rhizomicrobium sp.]